MITYSTLPFDVIYHICSTVWASDKKALSALSSVDRRTRAASIPFLFKEVVYDRRWHGNGLPSWDEFEAGVDALLTNKAIMTAIRYVRRSFIFLCI